jgi:hypothetical protein
MNARFWLVATPTGRELRNFGLIMAAAAMVLAGLAWYKGSHEVVLRLLAAALVFGLVTLTWKRALLPLYKVWMVIGGFLGFVNTHILLGLVFYVVFTPLGLAMRLFRSDPLERSFPRESNSAETYWNRRETPLLPKEHYERQF